MQDQVILGPAAAIHHRGGVVLQESRRVGGVIKPLAAHAGMGRRAKAQIVAAVPVNQVVAALIAGLCKVGDLVLPVAVVLQLLHGVKVEVRRLVAGGQTLRRLAAKGRIRLDLQQVSRDMGGSAPLDEFQRLIELRLRIMGQCQHDVAADVLKPCPAGRRKGRAGLPGRVGAAQRAQLRVPGRLHPKGDAVDPCLPEAPQAFLGDGLRVGLQGHLSPGHRAGGTDEPPDLSRAEQAGGAAAEIHGIGPQGCVRRKACQLPQQSVHIGVRHAPLPGLGVEIAIPAFGKAVRDMQIKSEGHKTSQPFS